MDEQFSGQPAFVQAGETTNVLISIAKSKCAKFQRTIQASVLEAKEAGEVLLEIKRRCNKIGEWTDHLQTIGVSRQQASKVMRIAANWEKLNHPASINEALKMLAEDVAEEEPPAPPMPPPTSPQNPPLCQRCKRNVRTGQAPTKGCPECRTLRANWPPKSEPPADPATQPNSNGTAPTDDTPEPPKPPKPPPNGDPLITVADIEKLLGAVSKSVNAMAHQFGLERPGRGGQAPTLVETPEIKGINRLLEELRKSVEQFAKIAKKGQAI